MESSDLFDSYSGKLSYTSIMYIKMCKFNDVSCRLQPTNSPNIDTIRCIFCNLVQEDRLFPARLNRFGPVPAESLKCGGSSELNGGIFRPYLSSDESTSPRGGLSVQDVKFENEAEFTEIGHSKKQILKDLVDEYGIFWAHDACLFWSRNLSRNNKSSYWEIIEANLGQVCGYVYPCPCGNISFD